MPQRQHERCTVPGCTRPHKARGYCQGHYLRHFRGVAVETELRSRDANPPERCSEPECTAPVKAKGLCKMHYARLLRHGHTRYRDRKKPAKICSVPGCSNWLYAKGMCHQHWQRRKKALSDYGVSPERLAEMVKAQDGKCAICGKAEQSCDGASGKLRDLSIDHDHETGDARGLLCNRCNRGLGYFMDSAELLRAAIAYLDRHRPPTA